MAGVATRSARGDVCPPPLGRTESSNDGVRGKAPCRVRSEKILRQRRGDPRRFSLVGGCGERHEIGTERGQYSAVEAVELLLGAMAKIAHRRAPEPA